MPRRARPMLPNVAVSGSSAELLYVSFGHYDFVLV